MEHRMKASFESEINQLHSRLCAGLADPKRILILYALADKDLSVTELSEALKAPQPTVSRHLKTLRERGLVTSNRDGQSVYYSLVDMRVIEALDILRKVLADLLKDQMSLARSVSDRIEKELNSEELD
jgi:ArsR family transcriptional regulator